MAISIDGFIAGPDDDTSWVSATDWENFNWLIKECGAIVMGRRTQEVSGDDFPYKGALNIVMTHDPLLVRDEDQVIYTDKSPVEIVEMLQQRGHESLLIIGGGIANTSFLEAQLIDEVFISVHPIILGKGIPLFSETDTRIKLKLAGVEQLQEDLVQLHYTVVK